jgi:hypothetical protein
MKPGTAPSRAFRDWIGASFGAGLVWTHRPRMAGHQLLCSFWVNALETTRCFRFPLCGGMGQISIAACQLIAIPISIAEFFAKPGGRK